VASAAANGHPGFVKSETVSAADGRRVRVNRQLRVLKAGELAMRAVAPGLHRGLRRMYDVVAPPIARRLRNPYLADAAYLLLKPAEWAAAWVLAGLLGSARARIAEILRSAP
jgi:hypothetical protein